MIVERQDEASRGKGGVQRLAADLQTDFNRALTPELRTQATYRIVKRLPAELSGQFPAPEQVAALLERVG